jgi:hypothetical protein
MQAVRRKSPGVWLGPQDTGLLAQLRFNLYVTGLFAHLRLHYLVVQRLRRMAQFKLISTYDEVGIGEIFK